MYKPKNILVIVFLIFSLLSCSSSKKQVEPLNYISYFNSIHVADSLYLTNNFTACYKLLDSLFQKYTPLNSDEFAEYSVYLSSGVKCGKITNIREKAIYGLKNFGSIQSLHNQGYEMYEEVKRKAGITNEEESALKIIYFNSLNKEYRSQILKIYNRDQFNRESLNTSQLDSIDKLNLSQFENVFKKYGFPQKNKIGSVNANDMPDNWFVKLDVLFMHQPTAVRERYLSIFLDGVKKGWCEPLVYASIFDKNEIENGRNQKYGTFVCYGAEQCPIENPEAIHKTRKEIGLPPLNYFKWRIKKLED